MDNPACRLTLQLIVLRRCFVASRLRCCAALKFVVCACLVIDFPCNCFCFQVPLVARATVQAASSSGRSEPQPVKVGVG